MEFEKTNISSDLEPRLQRLLEQSEQGITTAATTSTDAGEVAVIAKVADLEAWNQLNGVRMGANLGTTPDGQHIVTARIPVTQIEQIRHAPFVVSLKAGVPLKPQLKATIQEIRSRKDLLPPTAQGNQGEGVIVGIVDYGCDFMHRSLQNEDGSTRILAIWNQAGQPNATSPFGYGREHTREDIDRALQTGAPYQALSYEPYRDFNGTHGTHVTDIAAGKEGVAPKADIVFVEIRTSESDNVDDIMKSNFGTSVQLVEALRYIFDKAGDRPCVVNFSLGSNGGPHDGTNLAEQGIDALLTQSPNRAAVIAAGNAYDDGIHATGNVPQGGFTDVVWTIKQADPTDNELELWYKAGDQFHLELIAPTGASVASLSLGENGRLKDDRGEAMLFVSHRQRDPNNGDNVIGLFHNSKALIPQGDWIIRLHGVEVTDGRFHAWVERDDLRQTKFAPPQANSHTIGSLSCGQKTIVVGSYDAHKPETPLSFFSSAGPTRDGRQKPEISAPGHDVVAARSQSLVGVTRKSGTSMASPAVTGVVALILAEARVKGLKLSIDEIRNLVIGTARKTPPEHSGDWHPRYGHGRVDAAACVAGVQPQPAQPIRKL
jgi:subtilisin family serine protease